MKVAIRTDASLLIGSGHVMRCKTLADELHRRDAEVLFICRNHPGNLVSVLRDDSYPVTTLPASNSLNVVQVDNSNDYSAWLGAEQFEDAEQTIDALGDFKPDWLVVDHYGLDESWENAIRGHVGKIFVIDDLANRPHDCDILLNQNLLDNLDNAYQGLAPHHCRKLLGPRFALLRPEFCKARETLRQRDGIIRRILVFFGGVDPTGETEKAWKALKMLGRPDIAVDVVVGSNNPKAEKIEAICRGMRNVTFHQQISNMADLMAAADLAIGAGGTASWERCCVGLPAVVSCIADNQAKPISSLADRGAVVNLGTSVRVGPQDYLSEIVNLTPEKLTQMQTTCLNLEDGRGLERVILSISVEPVRLRRATDEDAEKVWLWRNHSSTRRHFLDPSPVTLDKHKDWWNESLTNNKRIILLASSIRIDVGVLRYDIRDKLATVSIYLDPELHGLGLGVLLLRAGEAWLKQQFPALRSIEAIVLPANISSRRSFASAGFCGDSSDNKWFKQIGRN